ncbi:MAG: hypothetical protein ACRD0K_06125 [Egibacteraceae bacterium]
MARADLLYAAALDSEIWQASRVDNSLFDPLVRVEGALPGTARPFVVIRDYQGPQGDYIERFAILDPTGQPVWRSANRRIALTGQMFEDRFTTTLADAEIASGEEHQVVFFIHDDQVGSIPMFIEAGLGGDPNVAAEETFKKALQKGTIIWLSLPGQTSGRGGRRQPGKAHSQAVWFVFDAGKVYVFNGPSEQDVPGLADAPRVEVIARSKDARSQVSRVPATVRVVPGDDPLFDRIGQMGMGRRLNLPDGEGALERWRQQCTLVELTPRFGPVPASTP